MIVPNLTTIVANLALARSINYDQKVRCKLKHSFTIVNCNSKPFIVQATGRASTNGPWFKGLNPAIQCQKTDSVNQHFNKQNSQFKDYYFQY